MTVISSFARAMVARGASPSSFTPRPADEFQEKIVRNTLISALMAGAAVYALPASAQTPPLAGAPNVQNTPLTVQTTIPSYCSNMSELGSNDVLDLGSLADGTTGKLVAEFEKNDTKELAPRFYCNAPSKVTIKAEPLTNPASVSDTTSFTNRVDYTASLKWGGGDALEAPSTEANGMEFLIANATIGAVELTLSDPRVTGPRTNLRPIAGDYEGKVILTISLN